MYDEGLIEAAIQGDLHQIKHFLQQGANVNAKSAKDSDKTALHLIMQTGSEESIAEAANFLLETGADMEIKDRWGNSALHCAAFFGRKRATKLLLERGANYNSRDKTHKLTPAEMAKACGYNELAELIITYATQRSVSKILSIVEWEEVSLNQLLERLEKNNIIAARVNEPLNVKYWGNADGKIKQLADALGKNTSLARLDVSIPRDHFNLNKQLGNALKNNSSLFYLDLGNNRHSAGYLYDVIDSDRLENNYAITHLNPTEYKVQGTQAEREANRCRLTILERNQQLRDQFHLAAKTGQVEVIEQLIKKGVSLLSTTGEEANTALHWAAFNGHTEVVKLLLQKLLDRKIPILILNGAKKTALDLAKIHGYRAIIELLRIFANPDQIAPQVALNPADNKDQNGNTPLHLACQAEDIAKVQELLAQGVRVNVTNNASNTPMHLLAISMKSANAIQIAKLLLEAGADTNITNQSLQTPLEVIANPTAHKDFVELLLQHRPLWKLDYLNYVIARCKIYYRGDFENRRFDKELLDKYVSRLTGCNVGILMEQYKWVYVGHLNSLKGEYKRHTDNAFIKFEGFRVAHFLPLRIRILFEIIIRIETNILPLQSIPKPADVTLQKLKNELIIELETLRAHRDQQFVRYQMSFEARFIQAHAKNLNKKISQLTLGGASYSYASGHQIHAIYINFSRQLIDAISKLFPRVDNLGDWVERGKHVLEKGSLLTSDAHFYPYALNTPEDYFNSNQPLPPSYLMNIIRASYETSDNAFPLVYATAHPCVINGIPQEIFKHWQWPAKLQQTVGNCVVKNHEIGLQIRWKSGDNEHQLYHWYREEEVKYIPLKSYQTKAGNVVNVNVAFAVSETDKTQVISLLREDFKKIDNDLHKAVIESDFQATSDLLSKGTDSNAKTASGYAALPIAVLLGNEAIVENLLEHGAHIDEEVFLNAVLGGNSNIIKKLQEVIERQELERQIKEQNYTDLHTAVLKNDAQLVKSLLLSGANCNAKTKGGYAPLHLAAIQGNLDFIKLLTQYGAKIDDQTLQGDTALTLATLHGQDIVVKELLAQGADATLVNQKDRSVWQIVTDKVLQPNDVEIQNCMKVLEGQLYPQQAILHLKDELALLQSENKLLRNLLKNQYAKLRLITDGESPQYKLSETLTRTKQTLVGSSFGNPQGHPEDEERKPKDDTNYEMMGPKG